MTEYAADYRMKINYSYYARYSPTLEPAARTRMDELASGKTQPGEMYIIKSPELFHQLCGTFNNPGDFLGYVNGEWVLAPGFNKTAEDYADVSVTGSKANCASLSLPDFLAKYNDNLIILAAMDDISSLGDEDISTALKAAGLENGIPVVEGMSYLGVVMQGKRSSRNRLKARSNFQVKKVTN